MNNKGFTLIELLAVIVILAIIALIATPIILGIINDARAEAKERSAELVYAGVEYAYTTSLYKQVDGASVMTTPTLDDINKNLTIDNMKDNKAEGNVLTIITKDDVTCTVKAGKDGWDVSCKDKDKEIYTNTLKVATK